ncbi:hypothetical protein [Ralstonia pseudosolanacearum]|uniref:hypothetical protein n=1 Tax=Ralstonia pseudosolanacearum TaxID=1310165 RepID=UPI0033956A4B
MKVHVIQLDDKLRATFEDGRYLVCDDPQELALRLKEHGANSADVTLPDWREGDIAPHSGIKIALFAAMKGHERIGH